MNKETVLSATVNIFTTVITILVAAAAVAEEISADVVVYGSSPAAISAAVQAKRMGRSVVVVSPETRIGGLTTGGLGQTDIGNKAAFGGIALEFYRAVADYYRDGANWKWQKRNDYLPDGQCAGSKGEDSMWTFEPSAALKILEGWEKRDGLDIRRGEYLDRGKGKVEVEGEGGQRRIRSFRTLSGRTYRGKVFVDATYEGDLMAAAGVSYTVGREANSVYGETLNGRQERRAVYHQFVKGVDPYVKPGDPKSGLLPNVEPYDPNAKDGEGDGRVQAYCFRMCLTDVPENRIPFKKPENYDERNYELLFRNLAAKPANAYDGNSIRKLPWGHSTMPNRKTDTNNRDAFSTDYIGRNWAWAEASYEEREKILKEHLDYQRGLMWTLANHPRVPEKVRAVVSRWGTCKDEFQDGFGDGWQRQLYVREARRMVGETVMTERHCLGKDVAKRPVAMAAYQMDSHHVRRQVGADGFVRNEGDVEVGGGRPYPIDYGAIVPKRGECANLLVPVCLSASHIAFGSIRMEPVFFALGQAAGTAAAQAAEANCAVQDLDYAKLRARLESDGQVVAVRTPRENKVLPGYCYLSADVDNAKNWCAAAKGRVKKLTIEPVTADVSIAGGFRLFVQPHEVLVKASDDAGFAFAYRTLRKMAEIAPDGAWKLPCCHIVECPRAASAASAAPVTIDLAGEWTCVGTNLSGRVTLPGTLADAKLGVRQTPAHFAAFRERSAKTSLARRYKYYGPATYSRTFTLSETEAAKPLEVYLERVMWASRVKIDGRDFGLCDSLGTPHVHAIPAGVLSAGMHRIEIEIDNSRRYGMIQHAHGWSEWMQSIWHGAIGRLEIREASPLRDVRVFADYPAGRKVRFEVPKGFAADARSVVSDELKFEGFASAPSPYAPDRDMVTATLAEDPEPWSEFNPRLYRVKFRAPNGGFEHEVRFGFRTVAREGRRLMLNGRPLFVRADVDNCGFPLTGYPAMTKREWRRILSIEKLNGMNALQMHTWTPPAAAFEAADEEGMMIFCELGYWEGSAGHGNKAVDDYLQRELKAVADVYGNHPSMVATTYGNELGKCNFSALDAWMVAHRRYDPRRLTMCSTARTVAPSDEFMVTHHYPGIGSTRGKYAGSADYDYENVYGKTPIPVIAHEIGQWPVYPMWDEQIPKFNGLLEPWRWPPLREAAVSNDTFRFCREFHSASMQTSRHFYKLETEGLLRTPSCAGIAYLDLRDYTGQGEALVGWYDAFFDAKPALGEVAPFSSLMRPVPFLARFSKFLWTTNETFTARLMVRNGLDTAIPQGTRWRWSVGSREGWAVAAKAIAPGELAELGEVQVPLAGFSAPARCEFRFGENSWRLYVLPVLPKDEPIPYGVTMTDTPAVARKVLLDGGCVIYTGKGRDSSITTFQPIYWSTGLFPTSLKHIGFGAVVEADHPALAATGCDFWQDEFWRRLFSNGNQHAKSYRLRDLPPDFRPIVTVVPDLHHSYFISPLYELRVGKGRLLACGLNLGADDPAARLLRHALFAYAASDGFRPKSCVDLAWFDHAFDANPSVRPVAESPRDEFVEDMKNKVSQKK